MNAAAQGLIAPDQALSLSQAVESQIRAIEAGERIAAQRAAAEEVMVYRRLQLRGCVVFADGVREIHDEAGAVDSTVRKLCLPILRIGESAREGPQRVLGRVRDTAAVPEYERHAGG